MFWFCKLKPIDVYFYTAREDVFNHARPVKSNNFLPSWWKELPRELIQGEPAHPSFGWGTLKSCPAVPKLYASGFMLPMWSDLKIELEGNGFKYQFADNASSIDSHDSKQFGGCNLIKNYQNLKLINPWVAHCSEDINFLTIAPTWNNFGYDDVVVLPGAYNFRHFISPNVNLMVKKIPDKIAKYSLFFGQPIAHLIPLSDRSVNLHYELVPEEKMRSLKAKSPIRLLGNNRYLRAQKLCPHGK